MAVLAALVLAACSGGDSGTPGTSGGRSAGKAGGGAGGDPGIYFAVTDARVTSMAAQPGPFPEGVWGAVVDVLNAYLDRGMVRPLRTGDPPGELEPLFTPAAFNRAVDADRISVLEDGTTPISGRVTADRATAALELLTDRAGKPVLVNAAIDVALTVRSKNDAVAVSRAGQVVFIRDDVGWRIDSYDLRAARDSQPA